MMTRGVQMKRQYAIYLVLVLVCMARSQASATPRHVSPASREIGWVQLTQSPMIDTSADQQGLPRKERFACASTQKR